MKKIVKNFNEYINEAVSDVVYHYTMDATMVKILMDNKIKLSSTINSRNSNDDRQSELYYLSLTRMPNANFGYGRNLDIRMKLNSRLLNANFKSIPVDYFQQRDFDKANMTLNRKNYKTHAEIIEYEDRIISNKPYINNISKYIEEIDILIEDKKSFSESFKENINKIYKLASDKGIPVNFYNNRNDLHLKKKIDLTNPALDFINTNIDIEIPNSDTIIHDINSYKKKNIDNYFYSIAFLYCFETNKSINNVIIDFENILKKIENIGNINELDSDFIKKIITKFKENYNLSVEFSISLYRTDIQLDYFHFVYKKYKKILIHLKKIYKTSNLLDIYDKKLGNPIYY